MKRLLYIFLLSLLVPTFGYSEIYKVAITDARCGGICFYWWPILPKIEGWQQDMPNSYHYSANAQVPIGETFSNAESVIYVKALFKPRMPETKTLQQLIQDDRDKFKENYNLTITELNPIKSSNGKEFKSYQFFPRVKGNYERVSYGEEGEFYLVFTLSSRSKKGYESTMPVYTQFIKQYREKK